MIKSKLKEIVKQKIGISKIQNELDILKYRLDQTLNELNNLKKNTEEQTIDFFNKITTLRIKNKLKNKEKINIIFFVLHNSVWQYENLYKKFSNDKRYNPTIVVVPYINYEKNVMIKEMKQTFLYFKNKNYNIIKSYDNKNNLYVDIKTKLQPDIVFFTNPHKITTDDFYIYNYFKDTLTCYVPYGIMAANLQQTQFNQPFHNLTWKNFYETNIHLELAKKYADNKGTNVLVTGYPKCDVFLDKKYKNKNVWKKTGKNLKKIIWAPHHTIEGDEKELGYSNFLKYHQIMLDVAQKYQDKIQIAFKPHPLLLTKLKLHPGWGEKKTKLYYRIWQHRKNTQLELDEYSDLFLSSDGIIMDSISFISEYLFVNKPALFMEKDNTISNKFNEFGLLTYNLLYKSQTKKGLINFIEKIILKENDDKKKQREEFLNQYLIPPNDHTATDNIFYYINDYLK